MSSLVYAEESKPAVRSAVGSQQDAQLVAVLVRAHLIALHQANSTGNYTVLRDLGSAEFRDQFSASDLAAIFEPLREERIDIQAAAVLQPEISQAPSLDTKGVMNVRGRFATQPQAIDFAFAFCVENRVWRLCGLSVLPAP